MNNLDYMDRALQLAEMGINDVSPNPAVGAVLVKNNKIIGEGYHRGPGERHAEIEAIDLATESPSGAHLYTTLEPCCSTYEGKRQSPCTDRIIKEKISHVSIASIDPDYHVRGKGIEQLKAAGIEVTLGVKTSKERRLNEVYYTNKVFRRPFVHLKIAQTLDGRIASTSGDSKWITDETARKNVHLYRARYDSILIGSKTAITDDPLLTVRHSRKEKPLKRIILNSQLNLPPDLRVFKDQDTNPTLIITGSHHSVSDREIYKNLGVTILEIPEKTESFLSIKEILTQIYDQGINSVYVEGGSSILTSFVREKVFDRMSFYIAPKICGSGLNSIGNIGTELMAESLELKNIEIEIINNQVIVHGWREKCLPD